MFTILHFSDTHEIARFEHYHMLMDKRIIGFMNNRLLRKTGHGLHEAVIHAAVERILAEKPDLVLFTGDATSCGQRGEFATALKRFTPILESPLPFLYIPGNHDSYVKDIACVKASREFCSLMNRGKYSMDDFPFVLDLGMIRLAAIHCARPTAPMLSCGFMSKETSDFLRQEAEKESKAPLAVAGHFPLMDPHPIPHALHLLYGAKEAGRLLRQKKIALSLCGHVHKPYAILDEKGRGEISAGSLVGTGRLTKITYDDKQDLFKLERLPLFEGEKKDVQ